MNNIGNNNPQQDYGHGIEYLFGRNVPQSFKRADVFLNRAALCGHPEAEYYLGLLYLIGAGDIEQDVEGGIQWLTLADSHSFGIAQNARLILEKPTHEGKIAEAHRLSQEFMSRIE